MKYRIIKTVKCETGCRHAANIGYGFGRSDFLDINEAHRQLMDVLKFANYVCGCQAGIIEVKD